MCQLFTLRFQHAKKQTKTFSGTCNKLVVEETEIQVEVWVRIVTVKNGFNTDGTVCEDSVLLLP